MSCIPSVTEPLRFKDVFNEHMLVLTGKNKDKETHRMSRFPRGLIMVVWVVSSPASQLARCFFNCWWNPHQTSFKLVYHKAHEQLMW